MTRETREQARERAAATRRLLSILKPGDTLYTIVRHVSASGMRRSISTFRVNPEDNEIEDLDFWVAKVVRASLDRKHGGVIQDGCGQDMGFHLVYNLGRYLWGQPDSDAAYALNQRWL